MKNLKMKALLLAAVVGVAQFASAGFLLWDVTATDSSDSSTISYAYAQIYYTSENATEDGTLLGSYLGTSATTTSTKAGASAFASTVTVAADVSSIDSSSPSYYFYVELYSSANELLATSSSAAQLALAETSTYYYSGDSLISMEGKTAYTFSSFTAVPEPTGGLLVLMGAALLGLRRKRLA